MAAQPEENGKVLAQPKGGNSEPLPEWIADVRNNLKVSSPDDPWYLRLWDEMVHPIAYDLHLLFWRMVINIFFREIRPRGAYNIPRDGAVIFVIAPHHNQFLDPLLVSTEIRREAGRRIGYLTAAKSMNRFVIGWGAKLMNSIPVARAADYAKSGSGRIILSPDDPTKIIGIGTKFTKECSIKGQIVLPKDVGYATGEIGEIISDTELRLTREFITTGKGGASDVKATHLVYTACESSKTQPNAKGKIVEGLAYKTLPHIDQHEVYGAVYNELNEGKIIGIFPEGGSHDRTDLLPLKAGVSVMSLGAMAANPDLKIKLVPVGLSYFHAHKFRSRAVVEFGSPVEVPRDLVEQYRRGGKEKREACGKLLEKIHDGLQTVTIRAPDFETLMVIQAARRLYKTPGQHLTLGQVVELNKRFLEAYEHYKDEPRIISLRNKIIRYNRTLRNLGLRDHQVERATTQRRWRNLALLIYRSYLLLAWSILALPGVILHAPIFVPAKIYSSIKAREAVAASTVKVAGRDVVATWKVLFCLIFTPILYTIYAILATYIAYRMDYPFSTLCWVPVWVFVGLPFLAMSALKFGEAGMDVFKSLRPLFLSLLPGSQKELENIRRTRENLSNELSELINEFGPKLWTNFYESRLLPNATVPQTGENPGFIYRKNQNVDSSVLSHPMLWLDERIFGWSRSAAKGPGAWNVTDIETPGLSPPGSPHESDDEGMEEDVDYDDVLAIIDTRTSGKSGRGRKRAKSKGENGGGYFDTSRSRSRSEKAQTPSSPKATKSTLIPEAKTDVERNPDSEVHHRKHTRTLNTGIAVDQIGRVTSHEGGVGADSFEDVTKRLNSVKEEQEEERLKSE